MFEFHRDGTLTMIFHAARAAQNGVEAAMLSAEGLTGPTTVLEGCTAESIAEVVVRCNPVVAHDNADQNPTTLLGARLSMPFNLSLVLAQGHVHVADVTEEHLHDPRIRANLNKVRLEADAAMPRFGSSVTVKLKDGRIAESTVRESLGDPGTPLAWDAVVEKFQLLTRGVIQASAVASIGNTVQNIEKSDGAQLAGALRQALIA